MAAPIPVQRRTSPKTCALVTSATAARGGKTVKFVASSAGPFDGFPDDEYVSSRILGVAMRLDPGAKMLPAPLGATKGVYCTEPAGSPGVGVGNTAVRDVRFGTRPGDAGRSSTVWSVRRKLSGLGRDAWRTVLEPLSRGVPVLVSLTMSSRVRFPDHPDTELIHYFLPGPGWICPGNPCGGCSGRPTSRRTRDRVSSLGGAWACAASRNANSSRRRAFASETDCSCCANL